jgi:acyl dehydratase
MSDPLYFDDFVVGQEFACGEHTITADEIVEFAREYDPQPQHTDPEAAKQSMLGGLAASGWHLGAIAMRLMVDNLLSRSASLGSPGVEELRWLKPVRPNDRVRMEAEVLETRGSESKPTRGFVRMRWTMFRVGSGGDDRVMMVVTTLMMGISGRAAAPRSSV